MFRLNGSIFHNLVLIFLVLGVFWCWHDNMRARETATEHVKRFCKAQHCQFLDGSVCLASMGISVAHRRVRRHYDFYYTRDNHERKRGTVIMLGREVEHFLVNEDSLAV